jgi:vancomycin resistance protein YoaR
MRTTTIRPRSTIQSTQLLIELLAALFFSLAFFFATGLAFGLGTRLWYAGRIFPGVSVSGVEVGGLTHPAAAVKIYQAINYPQNGKLLLQDQTGQPPRMVTPGQMGLFLDADTSATRAYATGRSGGLLQSASDQFEAWYSGRDLPAVIVYDQRISNEYLNSLAQVIDLPTIEASVSLKGTDVLVQPGQTGRMLDIPTILALLSTQIQTQTDGVVPLVIRETPPAVVDVTAQAEQARKILSAPLKLVISADQSDDNLGPWTFDVKTLAAMLAFERVEKDGAATYQVNVKTSILREYLNQLSPNLSKTPRNARFIFNDETGKLEVIEPSSIGREVDVEATIRSVQKQLLEGKHNIALEFITHDPPVSSTAKGENLGISELVHAETSYFYGSSAERVQNIQASASRFHGLLIAPGETFSMGQALGDISLDNGYAEALIIVGDRTVKGVGGGVCQVSTTLFRAAFFAGFPILERHSHAYRVSYYEKVAGNKINPDFAGMDATVFFPLVDFKFTNDTSHWLLMETYVNPTYSSITWKFYSTKDGREVKWNTTGPQNVVTAPEPNYKENPDLAQGEIKQMDWAADGADVTVHRTVTKGGEVYLQDTFYTQYQPWQAIFEYGPGTELPDQNNN